MSHKRHPSGGVEATMEITRGDDEVFEVVIEGYYTPGLPATYLDPPESGDIEDLTAFLDGEEIELTQSEYDQAWEILMDIGDDLDPDYDYDRAYDDRD